jgi:hypothetical protein
MLKARWLKQLQLFLLCVLAFTIPFPFIYGAVAVGALAAVWLVRVNIRELSHNIKERKALWPWLLYYLLFAISYFYSDDKQQSLFDLQTKLSLLLLPLIVGAGERIDRRQLERIFLFFVLGVALAAIICFSRSFYIWKTENYFPIFFYHLLAGALIDTNAIYLSWFSLFSLTLLLLFPWQYYLAGRWVVAKWMLIFLEMAFFLLLSSKMLILLFFALFVPYYFLKLFRQKQRFAWGKIVIAGAVFIGLFVYIFTTDNLIRQRYQDILRKSDLSEAWLDNYEHVDEGKLSNLTKRVFAWRLGLENVAENNLWLTGCGNGDAQNLQNERMARYKVRNVEDGVGQVSELYNIDLHNMFIQTLLMIGLPGLAVFCVLVFMPLFRIGQNAYKPVFVIFNISAILFMMQESALQTQGGIVYYVFFATVFWNVYYGEREEKTH